MIDALSLVLTDLILRKDKQPRKKYNVIIVALQKDGFSHDMDTYYEEMVISADSLSLGKIVSMLAVLDASDSNE